MTWTVIIAIFLAAAAGAMCYRAFVFRPRRKPRLLVIDYQLPPFERISVAACACNTCKNVVWAQRVDIEPPKFCAYCGTRFSGTDVVDDEKIKKFVVTD